MPERDDDLDLGNVERVMEALIRMPPKPHEEMKLGRLKVKPEKSPPRKKKAPHKRG